MKIIEEVLGYGLILITVICAAIFGAELVSTVLDKIKGNGELKERL